MIPQRFKFSKDINQNEILPPNMDYPYFERVRHTGFFHKENEFLFANACFLAEVAFIAYNHPSFIKYALHYAGFDDFKMFIGKNVARCFAATTENCLIVVFRGTELKLPFSIPGFIADFKVAMAAEANGGLVHSGFKTVLDEIWDGEGMLYKYLLQQKEKNPSLRIFFTGHSLGGALSLVAAARFPYVDCIYTFGCPRVGDKEFRDTIKAKVFRIVHNNDIVAELPPQKIAFLKIKGEYLHIGDLKFIDSEGNIRDKNTNKLAILAEFEKKSFLPTSILLEESVLHLMKAKTTYFTDHSPYYYPTKLWNVYFDLFSSAPNSIFKLKRCSKF